MWILRALAQFKGSERSPGLFQDSEDGYIKIYDSPSYLLYVICYALCSGYNGRFSVRGISVRNLLIANFRFSFYEICVQNQCGHETLRS